MIRVGASGWLHPQAAEVWPANRGPDFDPLEFAARTFGAIEVDATRHVVPSREHVTRWARAIAEHPRARIVLPLPRALVPFRGAEISDDADRFREALTPIVRRERLAAVTLALGEGDLFGPAEVRALAALARRLRGAPLVLEPQHASWRGPGAHAAISGAGWIVAGADPAPAAPVRLLRLSAPGRAEPRAIGALAQAARRIDHPDQLTIVLASNARPPDVPPSVAFATAIELKYVLAGERPVSAWPELVMAHPYLEPLTSE